MISENIFGFPEYILELSENISEFSEACGLEKL